MKDESLQEYSKKLHNWIMEKEEEEIIKTLFVESPVAVERLARLLHKYLAGSNSMLCPKCYSFRIFNSGGRYICGRCHFSFFEVEA